MKTSELVVPIESRSTVFLQFVFSSSTIFHCNNHNFTSTKFVEYQRSAVNANKGSSCTGCPDESNSSKPCTTISSVQNGPSSSFEILPKQRRPLQWHECLGQLKGAIDSAPLSDYVTLTYMKTPSTGKGKAAIADFAYCGTTYQVTLRTLERKFDQSNAVVSAHLKKLSHFLALKIRNSEYIISHSATNSEITRVFRSFHYVEDLTGGAVLGKGVQKLPPNLKGALAMHTVKNKWSRPTLLKFND